MAKRMTRTDFIEMLKKSTGILVEIEVSQRGGIFTLPFEGIHKGEEGFSNHTFNVYKNKMVGRGAGNVCSYLTTVSRNKDKKDDRDLIESTGDYIPTRRYLVDSVFVPDFLARVEAANDAILQESMNFVDHYDEHRAEFEENVVKYCIGNKCKTKSKKIVANLMKRYPSKEKILSAGIAYNMTVYKHDTYDLLDDATREVIDECARKREYADARLNVAKRCNEVLSRLGDLSNQIINNGKLHGSTIKGYFEAVELLRVVNDFEFPEPMPEISAFLSVASMAVDNPVQTLDLLIMGFMRFYRTQGMLNSIPYEDLDECYSREVIEDIGQDPNNGFDVIAPKLKAGQF